jgi:hypothetical protein
VALFSDAYKKLFKSSSTVAEGEGAPVCGNCDITHGGLSLTETTAWKTSKERLMSLLDIDIAQLHRDELDEKVRSWKVGALPMGHQIDIP